MTNKNPPMLTVGARALCKHSHRSQSGFWPKTSGLSEEIRNQNAEKILIKILEECVWINIHRILHDETLIECRNEMGYGVRWTIDGTFRGFLEPQTSDGHDKKWRH
jgi:hypothetical protein